jgi:Fur family transcriptional regulator, ferric uptake regulator
VSAEPPPVLRRPGWETIPRELRARGLRWTPQRRTLVEVLAGTDGHVTGSELVERCRGVDPSTTPSTVYRTLDVLEALGVVRHAHGIDGREEFHVLPAEEHGHLYCVACGESWEIGAAEAGALVATLATARGFAVDLSHLSIAGRCAACRDGNADGTQSIKGTPMMLKPPST